MFGLGKQKRFDLAILHDPWPGYFYGGQKLLEGYFTANGYQISRLDSKLWQAGEEPVLYAHLHGFAWLRDLRTVGGGFSRHLARDLIDAWMHVHNHSVFSFINDRTDEVPYLASRVAHLSGLFEFFGASADDGFRSRFLRSFSRQMGQLEKVSLKVIVQGPLEWLKALIQGAIFIGNTKNVSKYLTLLGEKIDRDINLFGLHISEKPAQHLMFLRDLLDIRHALQTAKRDAPASLSETIRKMAHYVRLFRHGDGKLATFGGGDEGNAEMIDTILSLSHVRGALGAMFPQGCVTRVDRGQSILMVSHGQQTRQAPAGSLEFSVGRQRLLTTHHMTSDLTQSASGLVIDLPFLQSSQQCLSFHNTQGEEHAYMEGKWRCGESQGIVQYHRFLYLDPEGQDLRGEEHLLTPAPQTYRLQFCLHPELTVQLAAHQRSVTLHTKDHQEWRLQLDDHHYFDLRQQTYLHDQRPVAADQLVVKGLAQGHHVIRWALRRLI